MTAKLQSLHAYWKMKLTNSGRVRAIAHGDVVFLNEVGFGHMDMARGGTFQLKCEPAAVVS